HITHNSKNSAYARDFQQEGANKRLTPESLSAWVKDSTARERYIEAFRRSDFEAMLHYYYKTTHVHLIRKCAFQSLGACPTDSRLARPVSAARRVEQYMGVAGERLDLAHRSPSRSLCPTRCGRSRHA